MKRNLTIPEIASYIRESQGWTQSVPDGGEWIGPRLFAIEARAAEAAHAIIEALTLAGYFDDPTMIDSPTWRALADAAVGLGADPDIFPKGGAA